MMVAIEFLLASLLMLVFSNGGLFSLFYGILSVISAVLYYLIFLKQIQGFSQEEKMKYKESVSYKLIIVMVMITTINIIYPLSNVNLIFGYCMLGYFWGIFMYRVLKKKILEKGHLMNFNFLFDMYSIVCLLCMLKEILTYAF